MRRTRFDDAICPIARVTDLMGDWWTPVVLRDITFGFVRFDVLQERLQISRATLTQRLDRLVEEEFVERVPYQDRPVRYEYRLTDKGRAFFDVLAAMWQFGEDWMFEDKPSPFRMTDRETGETVQFAVIDQKTGKRIAMDRLKIRSKRSAAPASPT
jgi:DNA-binding HxlR family transcriptional regulator